MRRDAHVAPVLPLRRPASWPSDAVLSQGDDDIVDALLEQLAGAALSPAAIDRIEGELRAASRRWFEEGRMRLQMKTPEVS